MVRYFFDLRSAAVSSVDEEGLLLPDVDAAHSEALSALTAAMQAAGTLGARGQRFVVEVRDELGRVLEVAAVFESTIFRRQ